jgi:myo-inositol 2-dehydrogenase/D-chiro-inositol 1-dehydrogenase
LQIGFNRRFDPNFRFIRESVRAGKIGIPHLVRITSRDPAPPPLSYLERSGGIFLDMTIHDFDMARFLVDQDVVEVFATGGIRIDPDIATVNDLDTVVVVLTFADGTICTIDNSRQAVYGYDQRVEVFGSKGTLEAQNNRPHNVVHGHASGIETARPHYFFLERYAKAYTLEMIAFIDAILHDKPVPVTGLDGRVPVVIGQAAWTSYHQHRPVRLDEF